MYVCKYVCMYWFNSAVSYHWWYRIMTVCVVCVGLPARLRDICHCHKNANQVPIYIHIYRRGVFMCWNYHIIVGWKPQYSDFLGRKINLSGTIAAKHSRSGPNSVYVDMSRGDNVQGIKGSIGPFWAKWCGDESPRSASFFVVNHATF